jgi:hypothetical protein
MPRFTWLDPRGRLTVRQEYRHLLDGPVEQVETEEGILLRPAPSPQEGLAAGAGKPTSL